MAAEETLKEVNNTIDTIRGYCYHADGIEGAENVADNIGIWLDQLEREIEDYRNALEQAEE